MSASNVPASARKYYVLMPVIRQKLSELNVRRFCLNGIFEILILTKPSAILSV